MLNLILSLFLTTTTLASITGSDDRHEIIDAPVEIQEISNSIAALVRKENLKKLPNGKIKLTGLDYQEDLGFCEEARFTQNQKLIANCSASLIGEDLLLTAGHCVEKGGKLNLDEFVAVFDYKIEDHSQDEFIVDQSAVYLLKSAPIFDFDHPGDNDVATLKLDRKVKGRKILDIDFKRIKKGKEIYMIGFPFGLAMKYTDNGFVTKETGNFGDAIDTFTSDLDSFSVNSGSSVFDRDTNKIIGILVRGSGPNYEKDKDRGCNDWGGLVRPREYFSEINYVDLIKK